ncbi:glycosyltransferase family 15 protein [Lasiosphaeris hirsuta]|uniref:Glycosyltransferase family 15 protein n=1 Tax=Lasiosphaeris hirsuta TaxID=260670 RepID=A0AA40DPG6_9PEZI|nr:glycosyltransferase family 15 protein [Lasiosphaeris hirsuta]
MGLAIIAQRPLVLLGQLRRRLSRRAALRLNIVLAVALALFLESVLHVRSHAIPRPPRDLDEPFSIQCRDPAVAAAAPRENATFVMLTRNSERDQARSTIENIERQFNQWFNYPVLFLNNEPWDPEFVRVLNASVSGLATFAVVDKGDWGYPAWMDVDDAKAKIAAQGSEGIYKAGAESYHHMCRFYSGNFYAVEALQKYRWYWRLEPSVEFMCAITYDPFAEMARRGKAYGYTVALWEVPETCPSLFRAVDDFRSDEGMPAAPMWRAMITPSRAPWPIRRLLGWWSTAHRTRGGDRWNYCHYWSNFEIADLDFFRGDAYQALFQHLDRTGGFYSERASPRPPYLPRYPANPSKKLHHFADIGYYHEPFFQCPGNAPGGQLLNVTALGDSAQSSPESPGAIGCRCQCPDGRRRNNRGVCLNALQAPAAFHRPGWWRRWRQFYPYTIGMERDVVF